MRRIPKVRLLLMVAVVAALLTLMPSAALAEKASPGGSGTINLSNGIYTLSVEDAVGSNGVGTFTVATGASHPWPGQNVLYGGSYQSPWSTYLTVRDYLNSIDYVSTTSGPSSSFPVVVPLDTCSPMVSVVGNAVIVDWVTPTGLIIQQVTALEGTNLADSRVRVTTNVSSMEPGHPIGIRYEWDLMIDGSDDAWFAERNPDGSWTVAESIYAPPGFERFETTDDGHTFSVYGSVNGPDVFTPPTTDPDMFIYANWYQAYSNSFDFPPTGSSDVGDSAVVYYWGDNPGNAIVLAPGQDVSVTQYLYALTPENVPPTTNPVVVSNLTSPTPTISWSYFDPEGAPQDQYEVEVWTGAGGTGTAMWDPAVGSGTTASVTYAGDPLNIGDTYYARVRASDGEAWGDWSETSFVLSSPPSAIPGISLWGAAATFMGLGATGALMLRRRRAYRVQ